MLSEQALRERKWLGLSYLQSVLEASEREFAERRGPISSADDTELGHLLQIVQLAALVTDRREVLLAAVRDAEDPVARNERANDAARDLSRLGDGLRYLAYRINQSSQELDYLSGDVARAAADISASL